MIIIKKEMKVRPVAFDSGIFKTDNNILFLKGEK